MAERELSQDISALKDDLNQLRQDVASLSDSLKKVVGSGAEAGRAKAVDELDRLYDQFKEGYESVRREGRHAKTGIEREIEDRPLTTLLGAFVVGVVLGKFVSTR